MYHSFSIKNFRCFDDLTIEGLGRINLIGGKNNIGKTALLEALWVHSGPTEPGRVFRLDSSRGLTDPDRAIRNLFCGFDSNLTIELCAHGSWGEEPRRLTVHAEENPRIQLAIGGPGNDRLDLPAPNSQKRIVLNYRDESGEKAVAKGWLVKDTEQVRGLTVSYEREGTASVSRLLTGTFLPGRSPGVSQQDVERYSRLEIDGQQDKALQILQVVEPALQRLTVLAAGQDPGLYADVGSRPLIPIELMGEGMSRILSLALAIASSPGGMLLVDEIENGLHYTVMEKVWQAIAAFARSYDVQIFATTHSRECVDYARRTFAADEEEEELRFYRIDRAYGKLRAVTYDREMLDVAIDAGLGFR